MKIQRNQFNFLLEGAAFAAFAVLLATGLAMAFRLPPGSGQLEILGMTRHEWGDVHFWVAATFLALMAVHLFMHWRWVWALAIGKSEATRRTRGAMFLVATAVLLLLAAVPWMLPVQEGIGNSEQHRGQSAQRHGGRW